MNFCTSAVLIEDDYDSEFRFGGRPLDTLQAIDGCGHVIYVGSFSKSLLPSLRLGFLIAPPPLRAALHAASYVSGSYCQWPAQAALASLISNGLLARHVRKMRREYAARHDRILATLTTTFGEWLDPIPLRERHPSHRNAALAQHARRAHARGARTGNGCRIRPPVELLHRAAAGRSGPWIRRHCDHGHR
jgi:histidinol-phosphate/aromatic aminotransferase/cobyric acid decarboxylase-like protein